MATILIAGAGYIGSALGTHLHEKGHRVWALRRRVELLPTGLEPLALDMRDPQNLSSLPESIDTVFYTAAAQGFTPEAYHQAYVLNLQNILDALLKQKRPPKRFIFTSSTGVYAQNDGSWVDENSPTTPTGFSGQEVLAGEMLLKEAPLETIALRFGGIYGPERRRLLESVRTGQAQLAPEPARYTNRIHRDDCVGMLEHLMELQRPEGVYNGVDSESAAYNEVLLWLAERLEVEPPTVGDPPRRGNKRCKNKRILQSGYRLRYPSFREGYEAMI